MDHLQESVLLSSGGMKRLVEAHVPSVQSVFLNPALEGRELVYDFVATPSGTIPDIQQVLKECSVHKMSDG